MLYCSYFNYMSVFKFLLTAYVQYNFYMCMSRVDEGCQWWLLPLLLLTKDDNGTL
jgi:hypothetical protein